MTHQELVDLTAKRIQRLFGCGMILKEATSSHLNMVADVFAIKKGGITFQFEIKTSLSDFLKDKKKPHRKTPEEDLGMYRYYVAPQGVIKPNHNDLINNPARWGLIEVTKGGRFNIISGLDPKRGGLEQFSKPNDFKNIANSNNEIELIYSYFQSMIINSQNNKIEVKAVCEKLCTDVGELANIVRRIK